MLDGVVDCLRHHCARGGTISVPFIFRGLLVPFDNLNRFVNLELKPFCKTILLRTDLGLLFSCTNLGFLFGGC